MVCACTTRDYFRTRLTFHVHAHRSACVLSTFLALKSTHHPLLTRAIMPYWDARTAANANGLAARTPHNGGAHTCTAHILNGAEPRVLDACASFSEGG